jgi:hypothetical protein
MSTESRFAWLAVGAAFLVTSFAVAQTPGQRTPCGIAIGGDPRFETQGLIPVADGLVYDSKQGLCWLADANLAGDGEGRARITRYLAPTSPDPENDGVTLPVSNPDGTMNFETALNWVNALNSFNGGRGWLDHNNWQLPTTIPEDHNCSSKNGGNFGTLCTKSALAGLYGYGLARVYPDSVVIDFRDVIRPLLNLQPGLY